MAASMNAGDVLHDTFDYTLQGGGECESLGPLPTFSSHPLPFENENAQDSTAFRPAESSSLGQSSVYPLSLHSAPNFDQRAAFQQQNGSELPFQTGSSVSMSPLASSRGSSSTSPSSAASSFTYVPHQSQYALNSNVSYHVGSHPGAASPLYSPSTNYPQTYLQVNGFEARPRLTSIPSGSGMPPPSRSSNDPSPVSPPGSSLAFRTDYSPLTALPRSTYSAHGNSFPISASHPHLHAMSRGYNPTLGRETHAPTNQYGFNAPMPLDASASLGASQQSALPFDATKPFVQLRDDASRAVQPELQAKIDKGFFKADRDWTCYRRNYFSVACSYNLRFASDCESDRIFLVRGQSATLEPVQGLAMSIAAKVDGEDGKPVELVQHTPKRDKGPMTTPGKKELRPNPSGNLAMYSGGGASAFTAAAAMAAGMTHDDYSDSSYPGANATGDTQNVANFERIQFKRATAHNGKRRAAQQYFHIVVELFARVPKNAGGKNGASSADSEWVKIAHRVSAQMVVRGRSPGHYQDDRRNSNASMGPGAGGHGGDYNGARDMGLGGGAGLGGSHGGATGYTTRLGHGAYQGHYLGKSHAASPDTQSSTSSAAASLRSSMGPFTDGLQRHEVAMEDAATPAASAPNGYNYYGGTTYDSQGSVAAPRPGLTLEPPFNYLTVPGLKEEQPPIRSPPVKPEPHCRLESNYSFHLPSICSQRAGGSPHAQWSSAGDAVYPPSNCRSSLLDTGRTYYPPTQAL